VCLRASFYGCFLPIVAVLCKLVGSLDHMMFRGRGEWSCNARGGVGV
jgi:hypothetical protein